MLISPTEIPEGRHGDMEAEPHADDLKEHQGTREIFHRLENHDNVLWHPRCTGGKQLRVTLRSFNFMLAKQGRVRGNCISKLTKTCCSSSGTRCPKVDAATWHIPDWRTTCGETQWSLVQPTQRLCGERLQSKVLHPLDTEWQCPL